MELVNLTHWERTGVDTPEGRLKCDRLVMRYMEIPARYDNASIHHPEFDHNSEVYQFLKTDFAASDKRCAVLIGTPGTGKTYSSIAFLLASLNPYVERDEVRSTGGIFVSAYDLAERLHRKDYTFLDRCKKAKALFIDDLGTEPEGYKGKDFQAHFQMMFNSRYENQLLTILTSNFTPMGLKEQYGERIVSRLAQFGLVYQAKGQDLRKVKA